MNQPSDISTSTLEPNVSSAAQRDSTQLDSTKQAMLNAALARQLRKGQRNHNTRGAFGKSRFLTPRVRYLGGMGDPKVPSTQTEPSPNSLDIPVPPDTVPSSETPSLLHLLHTPSTP